MEMRRINFKYRFPIFR